MQSVAESKKTRTRFVDEISELEDISSNDFDINIFKDSNLDYLFNKENKWKNVIDILKKDSKVMD